MLVFASGLVLLVAPLTSSVLAAAPDRYAGIASGINNAVARTGSLLAVSALPAIVGIGGEDYQQPEVFGAGYSQALLICAAAAVRGRPRQRGRPALRDCPPTPPPDRDAQGPVAPFRGDSCTPT